nr:putative RNA-directed DNA polymerase [Tanacetum cinerariifolium]
SQQAATRNRGKAIVNSLPPVYDQEPSMVAEDNEMSKDKEIDKFMALISLSFMKIYKPTNNNLRTSSNTSRSNQDNSSRINRGTGIQCYNCKEFGHVAKECQKPNRPKVAAYHKEKMLLCKQEEAGFQLNAEQADWRDDTDDESEDQELEAHYIKHHEQSESVNDTYSIGQDEHNVIIDSLDMSYDREQINQDADDDDDLTDERDLLASLIEKLKCEIDDSKNRNKFLQTSNKVLVDKLKGEIEDFKNKNKSSESSNKHFKEAKNELSKTNELMYKDLKKFQAELNRHNDVKINADLEKFHLCLKEKMVADMRYFNSLELEVDSLKSQLKTQKTQFLNEIDQLSREYYYADHINAILGVYTELDEVTNLQCDYLETLEKCECLEKELSKSKMMSKSFEALQKHAINLELDLQQCQEKIKNDKSFKENQSKEFRKEREQYFEIQDLTAQLQDKGIAISELKKLIEKMKGTYVETNLNAKTLNVNFSCATCGKCVLNVKHDMCVLQNLNGMNSRTKMPIVVHVSTREPKRIVNKSVAKPLRRTIASESTNQKPRHTTRKLYENVSKTCSWWYPKSTPPGYKWKPKSQIGNVNPKVSMPLGNASRTANILEPITPRRSTVSNTTLYFNSFAARRDYPIHQTITENAQVADAEFINIFCTPVQDRGETSSRHVDLSNMHTFYQRHPSEHRWVKDHPLEQVIGNPSQSVRTRRQLESDGEMCMFALIVSRTKPKNIKEAMADSAWIELMQEELHQFDRLDVWELVDRPLCKNVINMKWLWKNKRDEENTEEVYVNQPDGFVNPYHPDKVYRLKKALYGLKQAPRAWYDELSTFLVSKGFFKGGDKLVSWSSKKQDCTSMSSAEAEYVSLSACCAQVLWMRTQLTDYGFHFDKMHMYCDSKAATAISCNPVQHSFTKKIDVRYHFIKEKVEKGVVELFFVGTGYQLADLFTKVLSEDRLSISSDDLV